jgi:hypothetical protein
MAKVREPMEPTLDERSVLRIARGSISKNRAGGVLMRVGRQQRNTSASLPTNSRRQSTHSFPRLKHQPLNHHSILYWSNIHASRTLRQLQLSIKQKPVLRLKRSPMTEGRGIRGASPWCIYVGAHKSTRQLTLKELLIHQLSLLSSDQHPGGFRLARAQDSDRVKNKIRVFIAKQK